MVIGERNELIKELGVILNEINEFNTKIRGLEIKEKYSNKKLVELQIEYDMKVRENGKISKEKGLKLEGEVSKMCNKIKDLSDDEKTEDGESNNDEMKNKQWCLVDGVKKC